MIVRYSKKQEPKLPINLGKKRHSPYIHLDRAYSSTLYCYAQLLTTDLTDEKSILVIKNKY
jgi:hypothetical protein